LPGIDRLEGRELPSGSGGVDFRSAFGIGSAQTSSALHANAVATDPAGDLYLTGSFHGTVGFDPTSPSSTLSATSTQDAFVAKYGPTGALLWVRTFAGRTTTGQAGVAISAVSQGSAIAVDGAGDVFVAGSFDGTVDFGAGTSPTVMATPEYSTEAFAAKLDPSGTLTWARAVGGTAGDTDSADALALDGSGGVIVAGSFADSASFGPFALKAGGASEGFATRIDGSGNFLWAAATNGSAGSNAQVNGVAVDASGSVALAGFVSGKVGFAGSASGPLVSAGSDDAAIWKLDPSGHLTWARSFGSTDYDAATAVAFDSSGDLYATGAFSGTVNFATGGTPALLAAGPIFDEFALKLAPNGQAIWARGFVGPGGWAKGQGVAVDSTGNVHLAGTFSGSVDFDPGAGTDTLASGGSTDASLAGLDPNGNFLYALHAGLSNANAALGIAVNAVGLVAIAGSYSGSIAFGPTTVAATGVHQVFAATMQIPTPPTLAAPQVEAGSLTGSNNTTSATSPIFDVLGADPAATVELVRDGVVVARRTGPGAIQDPGPGRQGTFAYAAIQVNAFGVASAASPAAPLTILTTPPPAPAAPKLLASDNTGPSGGNVTNNRQFRLVGIASPSDLVQIVDATGKVYGSAMAGLDGSYTVAPASPLADGTYALSVRSVDLANNLGAPSPSLSIVLATRPATPAVPTLNPADVTGPPGSSTTSNRTPRIIGQAQAGTTVQILLASGVVVATAKVGTDGTYSATPTSPLADGTYAVDAVATDSAANASLPGPVLTFTILATAPAAPTSLVLSPLDDSGVTGDRMTNVRQPRLAGKATPGSTVQLLDSAGTVQATATAGPDGSYVVKVPNPLADGTYTFSARAVSVAGVPSVGNPSFALTILATPPAAPTTPALLAADDSAGPNLTNVRQPRLTGKAPLGTTVQILGSTGTFYGYAATGPDGTYVVPIASPLVDGAYSFHAVALDAAANLGAASGSLTVTILATPPARPAAPSILGADDTGVANDGMTANRRPRITGSALPGGRVDWIAADGTVVASTTASSTSGAYVLQAPNAFPDGFYSVAVRVTDPANNVSQVSPALSLTIRATVGDLFGDSRTDIGTFRPSKQTFNVQVPSTYALYVKQLGNPGDVPISGDFYGDGRGDVAVYTASNSTFTYFDTATQAFTVAQWGTTGDIPVPGDYNGVGLSDVAIYRPSTSTFAIRSASTYALRSIQLGNPGDFPVPADYFGNGRTDVAVWRPSNATFYIQDPGTNAFRNTQFGSPGDVPIPADYEGIGHADLAVYRPSNSTFYVLLSNGTVYSKAFGNVGDTPILGDFFGLGHASLALYRSSTSTTYALDPITGATKSQQWGVSKTDRPITPAPSVASGSGSGRGGAAIAAPSLGGTGGGVAAGNATSSFVVLTEPVAASAIGTPTTAKNSANTAASMASLSLERWRVAD